MDLYMLFVGFGASLVGFATFEEWLTKDMNKTEEELVEESKVYLKNGVWNF